MEKAKSKALATLLIVALALSIALTRTPTVLANTITGRPTVYVDNRTEDPLEVTAGAYVNVNLNGMTITGAQVWLWLSPYGGSEINTALGDRWYAGPFYMGDVMGEKPKTYTFTPPEPFAEEGRKYTFVVGKGWINGTIPLLVQGGVEYWIKISDVAPRNIIPSTEVGVSTNRIKFKPAYTISPLNGSKVAPNTIITVSGYATPVPEYYNVSQSGTLFNGTSRTLWPSLLVPSRLISKPDPWGLWNYTSFTTSFYAMDLMLRLPNSTGTITVKVVQNSTRETVASFSLSQEPRVVQLPTPKERENYGKDYTDDLTLNTGGKYNVTLNWFPSRGSFNIFLNNTLVASGSLNATGGVYNFTITIPDITSGRYLFRVVDNLNVEYNFWVTVKMVPYILVEPTKGCVGDTFTVIGKNFLDYVGQYVTVWFEIKPTDKDKYKLLANFTVPAPSWSKSLTVPLAVGDGRSVEVRDIKGETSIATTTFTVLPKVVVVPSTIKNDGSLFFVNGTGFAARGNLTVNVDNQALLPGGVYVTCNDYGSFKITLVAAGFRPGLHVVTVYEYGVGTPPAYYATFTVTVEGDPIVEFLKSINATIVGIRDGMAVIRAGQEELKVSLSAISARIESIDGDVATIKTALGTVTTTLDAINAKLVSIDGDVATIRTDVGTIKTDVSALKPVVTEIKDGVATVSTTVGAIKGRVETIDGNVATIRTDVGVVKAAITDVKAAAEAATSAAKGAESVASSLMIPVWVAAAFAIIATIIAIASVVLIQRKIAK
jgi:prefoldin subunit 5